MMSEQKIGGNYSFMGSSMVAVCRINEVAMKQRIGNQEADPKPMGMIRAYIR